MTYTPNDGTIPAGIVYNPTGNDLTKWKAALNRVANNAGNAHVLWVGTSTVEGANSGGNNNWELAHTLESIIAADLTNVYGVPANADSIFGSNLPISDSDSRVVVGAGWVADTVYSIGGPMLVNTTTTNSLDYTMPTTSDRVKIWYATDNSGTPTLGTFSWKVNSGSTTNINQGTTSPSITSTTITLTPGANVLHIARVSGTCKIIGIEPYLSTLSTINVINSGVGGIVAASFSDASGKAYATNTAWNAISPDLTLIQMDNNDALSSTPAATYKTNITSVITGSNTGDCVLISQIPYGASAGDVTVIPTYTTALKQVASASSVPFIDQTKWIISYDNVLTPIAWSNCDGLHASPLGYIGQAQFILDQIMEIANVRPVAGTRFFNGVSDYLGATNGFSSVGPYWLPAQAILNVSGAATTNGTAQVQMRVADNTTGGGSGIGGGVGLFFDDGNSIPRMGGAIWTSKFNGTVGNYGADTLIGARTNGSAVSTMLKLSSTNAMSTFTGGVTASTFTGAGTSLTGTAASLTAGAVTGLSITAGKTLTVSNTITLVGTDSVSFNVSNNKLHTCGFSVTSPTVAQQGTYYVCPFAGTISAWNIVVDTGTATVKVWKIATGTTAPTASNSINTSGIAISTGTAIRSTTLSDFTTTTVTANDIFGFEITAVSGATKIDFQLEITAT